MHKTTRETNKTENVNIFYFYKAAIHINVIIMLL